MTTTTIIPSYPYVQFSDDGDVVAFYTAYNEYAQSYLDWLNDTPLAIYTNDTISGPLLDWIANGIYGIYRVPISSVNSKPIIGPLDTYTPNQITLNTIEDQSTSSVQNMTDDIFKRLITWDFYKGDGMQLTIPWLKKRIARFIFGIGGFDTTHAISVKITSSNVVNVVVTANASYENTATILGEILSAGIANWPIGLTFGTLTFTAA